MEVFPQGGEEVYKPTVLSNGDWLQSVDVNNVSKAPAHTQFYVSRDQGQNFTFLSKHTIEDISFSEYMAVERNDGSVWMLARTNYGIAQADSLDRGTTWVNERSFTTERSLNTRFFLRKLKSGAARGERYSAWAQPHDGDAFEGRRENLAPQATARCTQPRKPPERHRRLERGSLHHLRPRPCVMTFPCWELCSLSRRSQR